MPGPKNPRELEHWTHFATAALSGVMAQNSGAYKEAALKASNAADELLEKWVERYNKMQQPPP